MSGKSIETLKKKDLSNKTVTKLRSMENVYFESPEIFIQRMNQLESADEIMAQKKQLLKTTKNYFRLDRWIKNKTLHEWIETIIFALIVATIVRTYLFAPFQIPSNSMIPTIQINDHIFANMYSYGSPIPLTEIKLLKKPIHRGDIIIFPYPQNPNIDYIKRVVGMPKETLKIRKNQVYINKKLFEESYAYFDQDQRKMMNKTASYPISNYGPIKIPKRKLFVMGDNRYNNADNRFWGFVDTSTVVGKEQMIYWNHDPRKSYFSGYQLDQIFSFLK